MVIFGRFGRYLTRLLRPKMQHFRQILQKNDLGPVDLRKISIMGRLLGLCFEGKRKGCKCVQQMVREGHQKDFTKCCHDVWQWIQNVKKDKNKVKIIMHFAPKTLDDDRSAGVDPESMSPTEKLFIDFKAKTEACLHGGDFGELRTDKLAGSLMQPSKLVVVALATFVMANLFKLN